MRKITFVISIIVLFLCLIAPSCANRGQGPQGGPKDTIPPVVLHEMPANGSLNSKVKEIEVTFDELILAENTMENVIISPPQTKLPEIKSRGKKLVVVFNEDLIDSTTYTIDFGNSIVDNNEKNPLRGYTYAFSTGPTIDSLQISGYLLNAEDLNPVEGCLVGLHADLSDTAFTSKPFTRVTRTDSVGYFTIKNIKEGQYKIFALNDLSRDYIFQAGEGLAFCDSLITPYVKTETVADTIFNDSLFVDSIVHKNNILYGPDNILLFYFKENKIMRRLLKTERPEQHFFRIYFSAPADSLPHIEPIGEDWSKNVMVEYNNTKDTIVYWLKDSLTITTDTLNFAITYLKTDSLFELYSQTDTLSAVYRHPRIGKKAKQTEKQEQALSIKTNASSSFEIYNNLVLSSPTPIASVNDTMMHLYEVIDSTLNLLPLYYNAIDSTHKSFSIRHEWKPTGEYVFQMDSACMYDIYGKTHAAINAKLKIKSLEDYSNLIVKITPYDSTAIIQLLNPNDQIVRELQATEEGVKFENVKPGDYYLRMFYDSNHDGKWTTGNQQKKIQPEKVVYSAKKLTLRANWDFEELWNLKELPVLEQKPSELKASKGKK